MIEKGKESVGTVKLDLRFREVFIFIFLIIKMLYVIIIFGYIDVVRRRRLVLSAARQSKVESVFKNWFLLLPLSTSETHSCQILQMVVLKIRHTAPTGNAALHPHPH